MNKFQAFLQRLCDKHGGHWVDTDDLKELVRLHRLCQCLVRCGRCRFIAGAQDIPFLLEAIEGAGDYARDVQILGSEIATAGQWREEGPLPQPKPRVRPATTKPAPMRYNPEFREEDCGGVFDGSQVTSDADPGL